MTRSTFFDFALPVTECGCWIWMRALHRSGYGVVKIDGKVEYAHRHAWRLAHGPIPDNLRVLHHCDVTSCVNPDHLFLGTAADNTADMMQKGRCPSGENSPHSKLSAKAVREIRASNESVRATAVRYGIARAQVSRVRNRIAWAHLDKGAP